MAASRVVFDGLWRCLCPSVDAVALLRAVGGAPAYPSLRRSCRTQTWTAGARSLTLRAQRKCISIGRTRLATTSTITMTTTTTTTPPARLSLPIPDGSRHVHGGASMRVGRLGFVLNGVDRPGGNRSDTPFPIDIPPYYEHDDQYEQPSSSPREHHLAVHALLCARPPYRRELMAAPTSAIYAALQQLQNRPGAFGRIQAFARHLVDERGVVPTAALYEALVRANCHTGGSADAVRDVLRALARARIEGTPSLYHGALSVLAVHPDYLLRAAVLRAMRARWIDLAPEGAHSVALGLLRDGQYERALDQLETMTAAAATAGASPVPAWLLDIYVYVLGQADFLDDALTIVNHRLLRQRPRGVAAVTGADFHGSGASRGSSNGSSSDVDISTDPNTATAVPLNIWAFLLDACCRQGHYDGVVYVWNRVVRPGGHGLLTPSDATALDVLNLAARHADAHLAAAVMQMLAARGTKLGLSHFEAVVDCYAHGGAVRKALQALCIMNNAGVVPDPGSTRSIYRSLIAVGDDEVVLDEAAAALFDLAKKYGCVPIAAFNVVIEAMLVRTDCHSSREGTSAGTADTDVTVAALNLYRHVRQLCPSGPNHTTFRLLFRGCAEPHHLDFLLREMRAFGLEPDMAMIDRVVYENVRCGSLELALRYVHELMAEDEREPQNRLQTTAGSSFPGAKDDSLAEDMQQPQRWPRWQQPQQQQRWISSRTATVLAKRCIDEEDERIWAIADASRDRGRPMDVILHKVAQSAAQSVAQGGIAMHAQVPGRAARVNAYGVPHAIELPEGADGGASPEATLLG